MKRTRPWELSAEVWERVRPLIPERAPHPKGGRPAQEDRQMLAAILYVYPGRKSNRRSGIIAEAGRDVITGAGAHTRRRRLR